MFLQLKRIAKIVWDRRQINRRFNKYYIKYWIIHYWKLLFAFVLSAMAMTIIFCYISNPSMSLVECKNEYLYYFVTGTTLAAQCIILLDITYAGCISLVSGRLHQLRCQYYIHGLMTVNITCFLTNNTFNASITRYPINTFMKYWVVISLIYMVICCALRLLYGVPNSYVQLNSNSLIATKNIECTDKLK